MCIFFAKAYFYGEKIVFLSPAAYFLYIYLFVRFFYKKNVCICTFFINLVFGPMIHFENLPPCTYNLHSTYLLNTLYFADAGKSTIGGQMMYLTGMVDKRTLEKYEKEAKEKNRETWYLSWCMDTNSEGIDLSRSLVFN